MAPFLRMRHRARRSAGEWLGGVLTELQPVPPPEGCGAGSQWQALLQGLRAATGQAAAAGLPLPEPLAAWAEWLIDVGWLSFPTGRAVGALDRPQPLPALPTTASSTSSQYPASWPLAW